MKSAIIQTFNKSFMVEQNEKAMFRDTWRNNVKLNIQKEKCRKIEMEKVHQQSKIPLKQKHKRTSTIQTINELKNIGRDYIEELRNESQDFDYSYNFCESEEVNTTLPTFGEFEFEIKQKDKTDQFIPNPNISFQNKVRFEI